MTSRHSTEVSVLISFFKMSSSTENVWKFVLILVSNDIWPKLAFIDAD